MKDEAPDQMPRKIYAWVDHYMCEWNAPGFDPGDSGQKYLGSVKYIRLDSIDTEKLAEKLVGAVGCCLECGEKDDHRGDVMFARRILDEALGGGDNDQ